MKVAAGLAGGALLILAVGLGVWFGPGLLHRSPQPRLQLTVGLDIEAVPKIATRTLFAIVRDAIREPRIGFASIAPAGDTVEVTLVEGVDREQALARLGALSRPPGSTGGTETERFAITEAGGAVLRLTPTPAAIADEAARVVDQTVDVLGRRLDRLRLKPTIHREGSDRVIIDVPLQPDAAHLAAVLVAPGKLAFRLVDTSISVDAAKQGQMPPQSEILQGQDGTPYLVEKRIAMSGENLVQAQPGFDQSSKQPIVSFRFNAAGTRQFARVTEQAVGLPLAVVLDDVVLAVPVIREPIVGGSGQISGGFSLERANDLAILLQSGALPLPLTFVEERTVGP